MNAQDVLGSLAEGTRSIERLIGQLDEIQVAFNARFDALVAQKGSLVDRLVELMASSPEAMPSELRPAVDEEMVRQREQLDERRRKLHREYLPQRERAADELLQQAQAQLAQLRAANPSLNEREEAHKKLKAELEAGLAQRNDEIRRLSRGLGVALRFGAISRADRDRQRSIGKLEAVNASIRDVRQEWDQLRSQIEKEQTSSRERWQLEKIAVARLRTELDQLDNDRTRESLALRRALRVTLETLTSAPAAPDPGLASGLEELAALNVEAGQYEKGLAAVGGLVGLCRGIADGTGAVIKSIEGLKGEQDMHSAHLKPLRFSLPAECESLHRQWPVLASQFADEKLLGNHPLDFAASVQPILNGPLSQKTIEATFKALGVMISQATANW